MDVLVKIWNDVENGKPVASVILYGVSSKEEAISTVRAKAPGYQHYEAGEIVDATVEKIEKDFWNKQPSYVKRDGKNNRKGFWGKKNKKI
jgi:hypothetical protein